LPWSVSTKPAAVAAFRRVEKEPASVAVWTMSLAMAAADGEARVLDGTGLAVAAVGVTGLAIPAVVGTGLGGAAAEHAAAAIASADRRRRADRFMTGGFLSGCSLTSGSVSRAVRSI
jgi:hypothetical protein